MTTQSPTVRFGMVLSVLISTLLLFSLPINCQQPTPGQIQALPPCSLAKTNQSCKLVIDREKPVAPPAVQMYSGQKVTVILKNALAFERYFLDYQTGQATVSPDVAAAVVQPLLTPLGKLQIQTSEFFGKPEKPEAGDPCAQTSLIGTSLPGPGEIPGILPRFQMCLAKLAHDAINIYRGLEPFVAPDSLTPLGIQEPGDPANLQQPIAAFVSSESVMSSTVKAISANIKDASTQPAITQLSDLQKLADAVASDLLSYGQRIKDLSSYDNGSRNCASLIDVMPEEQGKKLRCVYITSRRDDQRVYHGMVTRTITYSLDALNLIANSQQAVPAATNKRALAKVTISFADEPTTKIGYPYTALRWEASAGVFFSVLPIRSFSVAPTYNGTTITDNIVAQNVMRPTVVPFAAANYRLTNDLTWTRWKSDLYWTGAVGVNPNTVSADFATGPSLSWRSLMFSAFCHFGHDVKLVQGFQNKEDLGPSFGATLPTKTYWTATFALGVSVRIPSLTGR